MQLRANVTPSIKETVPRERLELVMEKKRYKKIRFKRKIKSKTPATKKGTVMKKKRKVATKKKSKPSAARKSTRRRPPETLLEKVEDAFTAVADTLTDAEHLHRKLDRGISREPE